MSNRSKYCIDRLGNHAYILSLYIFIHLYTVLKWYAYMFLLFKIVTLCHLVFEDLIEPNILCWIN